MMQTAIVNNDRTRKTNAHLDNIL